MNSNYRIIGIKSVDQALAEAGAVMKAVMNGESVQPKPPEYNFTSFEAFRKALPVQRFNLLKVIRDKRPESLQELAAITGRDLKNISEDVKVLVEMGLVELNRQNRAKQPHLVCDGIKLEIAI
jgi:predicted transcriptional regulator